MNKSTDFFWRIARIFLQKKHVSEGTLMGYPCLRYKGDFFATADHFSGDLIVKLPAQRVKEIIESGAGQPFAPAGKVFKEWVCIQTRSAHKWETLMDEAIQFAKQKIN